MKIEQITTLTTYRDELIALLNDSVENGASVGFLAPLAANEAERYWQGVEADLTDNNRTLLVALSEGRITGSVQIAYCKKQNGRHRAEVEKLMVHTAFRRCGVGKQLMEEVERLAQMQQRTLLILDTRSGDAASILYRKSGYQEAGRIPQFAYTSDCELAGTTIFYKLLKSASILD